MNHENLKEYIQSLENVVGFLKNLLEEEKVQHPIPNDVDRLAELTTLRMLAKSSNWPVAVPDDLICEDKESDKINRAVGIVQDFIKTDLHEKVFLDFGCGEGHIASLVAKMSKKSVGYDLSRTWKDFKSSAILTIDWEAVKQNGPYDVILVNDVLDHTDDPAKELELIRSVKMPETGKVYMRCHPWTSRHGTHLYKQLNKAYLHLIFSSDELYSMGLKETKTIQTLEPIAFYKQLIKDAGFTILQESTVTQPVELFFTRKSEVLRRIKEKWKNSTNLALAAGTEFPREAMEIQFADFVLI